MLYKNLIATSVIAATAFTTASFAPAYAQDSVQPSSSRHALHDTGSRTIDTGGRYQNNVVQDCPAHLTDTHMSSGNDLFESASGTPQSCF